MFKAMHFVVDRHPLRAGLMQGYLSTNNQVQSTEISQDFKQCLMNVLQGDVGPPGTGNGEDEILASSASASDYVLQQIAKFDGFIRKFIDNNPDKAAKAVSMIGQLRNEIFNEIITLEKAVEKLKDKTHDFNRRVAEAQTVKPQEIQMNMNRLEELRQKEEALHQLHEEVGKLQEFALENFGLITKMHSTAAEVWVQQVFPAYQQASIFNGGGERKVPYDPQREQPDIAAIERDNQEWDSKFEAEWEKSELTRIRLGSSQNDASKAVYNDFGRSDTAVKSARQSVPNGEKLFSEMVAAMQTGLNGQSHRISLELHPDYLGGLKLKLSLNGDKMDARFLVQNPSVRNLMVDGMDELKASLEGKGIALENVEIALAQSAKAEIDNIQQTYGQIVPSQIENTEFQKGEGYFKSHNLYSANAWVV